ncbi:MAG: DUF4340 domain-containing protein [Bacteroidia bacterium]|nr:DUF4340 domain-containing protein [Bacteroidia bacterium]
MNWNNKILAIIFFALFGIWILTNVINKPATRSFRSTLLAIDTSSVDRIILYPDGIDSSFVELRKEGNGWRLQKDQRQANADPDKVKNLLGSMVLIPTKQLVSKKPENQANYEVDEATGKIVEVYSGDDLIERIIFGRFNFNQATRSSTSYARLSDENEIYALDGMAGLSFDKDFNAFRNTELCRINPVDIKGITYNDQQLALNDQAQWVTNGVSLDSTQMANYLNGLRVVTNFSFADDFVEMATPDHRLQIIADNQTRPLEIKAYARGGGFVVKSSENEAFFTSDSTGVYQKVFGQLKDMMAPPTN